MWRMYNAFTNDNKSQLLTHTRRYIHPRARAPPDGRCRAEISHLQEAAHLPEAATYHICYTLGNVHNYNPHTTRYTLYLSRLRVFEVAEESTLPCLQIGRWRFTRPKTT
jgi:hypothetical protein